MLLNTFIADNAAGTGAGGGSAVAYISDADKQDQSGLGSAVFTSFAVSGTHPAIIICSASVTDTITGIAVSAGLTSGTIVKIKSQVLSTTNVEIWAIPAPSGTGTITVTYVGTTDFQCNAILVQNTDQTTPCPAADSTSTTGVSQTSLSVTPSNLTANDMAIYMGASTVDGDAPHASTGVETFYGDSTGANAAAGYHLGTGSVTITWGAASTREVIVAVRVASG